MSRHTAFNAFPRHVSPSPIFSTLCIIIVCLSRSHGRSVGKVWGVYTESTDRLKASGLQNKSSFSGFRHILAIQNTDTSLLKHLVGIYTQPIALIILGYSFSPTRITARCSCPIYSLYHIPTMVDIIGTQMGVSIPGFLKEDGWVVCRHLSHTDIFPVSTSENCSYNTYMFPFQGIISSQGPSHLGQQGWGIVQVNNNKISYNTHCFQPPLLVSKSHTNHFKEVLFLSRRFKSLFSTLLLSKS